MRTHSFYFTELKSPSYWVPSEKAGRTKFMHIMARPQLRHYKSENNERHTVAGRDGFHRGS